MTDDPKTDRSNEPAASVPGAQQLPDEIADTVLDFRRLLGVGIARGREYRAADPFPHVVLDDFLPEASLDGVLASLPVPRDPGIRWGNVNADLPDGRPAQKLKHHVQHVLFMQPKVRQLIYELNSAPFLMILRHLTGITGLISDPQLQGGGVHIVERGGLLRVHADFNKHPAYGLDRRLNLLLYLNPGWDERWGGELELWDRSMTECRRKVAPLLNRCVVFATSRDSFHGHPHPLMCPPERTRVSVALYYYTLGRPGADERHGTLWQDLPSEAARDPAAAGS